MQKTRLDLFLVEQKLTKTRSQAEQWIKKNMVFVDEKIINKPSFLVSNQNIIRIKDIKKYVSNGGYKLQKIIDELNYSLANKIIVDIGASTGGFSDCCLQYNAQKIYAIDVGENLLDPLIKNNPKVIDISKTNVKNISKDLFKENIDLIVCDLSFIALSSVFKHIQLIANQNTEMFLLIKPQFELGKLIADKYKGIIKNKQLQDLAIKKVQDVLKQYKYTINHITATDIIDEKKQNQEFMIHITKNNE